jgi:peptidyl-prolyl cis-trans isomerase C
MMGEVNAGPMMGPELSPPRARMPDVAMISGAWSLPIVVALSAAADLPLATYQGGDVTRAEYEGWLLAHGLADDPAAKRGQLEAIALLESLEAAAVAAGLDRQPRGAFRLAQIETGLLAAALTRDANRAVVIGDAEVEAVLKAEDKERFKPRTVRLRNVFKRVPPGAPPSERAAVRERMEDVRRRLLAGADFDELAWRESDSQTRFRGGAMGYVPRGVLHPEVDRVAFALRKGELSQVLESADGFTLLRCDDIAEERVIPLDEARATIRQALWTRASEARQAELRSELLREAAPRFAEGLGADDSAAVEFQGGRVTVGELRFLASGPLAELSAESRRASLEEQVVRVRAAARARERGLDRDATLRATARWQRARLLATEEVVRRVNRFLVPPTDAEMRAHYQRNRDRYQSTVQVDVSVIQWRLEAQPARQFAEGEALLRRLQSGELTFEQAARESSVHSSSAQGGRLGFLAPGDLAQLGPHVFRTVGDLAPGQTSGLVQQDKSLFLVKLWERRPARPLAYEEAVQLVEKEVGDARVAALQKELEAEALRALRLEVTPGATAAEP